jgi:hypothetical protein
MTSNPLNQRIHGVRVLGTLGDLPTLVKEHKPEEVVVAIPMTPTFLGTLSANWSLTRSRLRHYLA